jgi:hypothetical protein
MLNPSQCAVLKQVQPAPQVQKPCTKPVVKEVSMREAFNAFSIVEYQRSKSI